MKPRIRGIHIPRPCAENWDSMDRAGGTERYCSRCEHCVTDFTGKTDREIIERVLASEGRICGRLTRDQLDRVNLSLRPDPQPSTWRSALLALAGIACTVPPATATTLQSPVAETAAQTAGSEEEKVPREASAVQEPANGTPTILKGRILKKSDGQPLGGVDVEVSETDRFFKTDSEGWFQIDLGSFADPPRQMALMITHEGYQPVILTFSTADAPPEITVQLQEGEEITGEIITVPWKDVVSLSGTFYKRNWRRFWPSGDRWRQPERRDTPGALFRSPEG